MNTFIFDERKYPKAFCKCHAIYNKWLISSAYLHGMNTKTAAFERKKINNKLKIKAKTGNNVNASNATTYLRFNDTKSMMLERFTLWLQNFKNLSY